jgi:hypothetical protein
LSINGFCSSAVLPLTQCSAVFSVARSSAGTIQNSTGGNGANGGIDGYETGIPRTIDLSLKVTLNGNKQTTKVPCSLLSLLTPVDIV